MTMNRPPGTFGNTQRNNAKDSQYRPTMLSFPGSCSTVSFHGPVQRIGSMRRLVGRAVVVGLILFPALIGIPNSRADERLPVVASIVPLKDFCEEIGSGRIEVHQLIPAGASPHIYEPPPSVIGKAAAAKVVVYVGAGLEPWIDRILSMRSGRDLLIVEAVKDMHPIDSTEKHSHSAPGRLQTKNSHGRPENSITGGRPLHRRGGNPHVWLDPILARRICQRIAEAFQQADPANAELYEKRLGAYLRQLSRLHREIWDRVAAFRIREYVCFHPSFTYFAQRYNLEQVGVVETSPGREPTPRHLQRIIEAIQRFDIRVVFAEPQFSDRAAQVIAHEAGVEVIVLDPIGGRPPYGDDYIELMRYNISMMEKAMK